MKPFAKSLLAELNQQLQTIHTESNNPIKYCKPAIKAIIEALDKLKTFTLKYEFKSQEEEIEFFKTIKPKFTAKLLYYSQIYQIESSKLTGSKKHYRNHLKKLNKWHKQNAELSRYLKTKNTCLDHMYFLRNNFEFRLTIYNNLESDNSFGTTFDDIVAQIKANKAIRKYLKEKLKKSREYKCNNQSQLKWTASKVSLIELLYAFHATQPFNNGNTSLNEIVQTFESLFNIKLGQYHRTFYELCARKTIEPTHFLNTLKEKLTTRIQNVDQK